MRKQPFFSFFFFCGYFLLATSHISSVAIFNRSSLQADGNQTQNFMNVLKHYHTVIPLSKSSTTESVLCLHSLLHSKSG